MGFPRWPWQSVQIADLIERRRVAEVAQLKADLAAQEDATAQAVRLYESERKRFDDLLQRQQESAAIQQADARSRSRLTQAIREQARMPDGTIDPRLINHLRGEATKLLRTTSDVEDVIEAISTWQSTEDALALTADRMAEARNKATA